MNCVKRLLTSFLAVATVSSAMVFAPASQASLYRGGDADRNAVLDARDANIIKKTIADGDASALTTADVNGDGLVDAKDVFYLKCSFSGTHDLDSLFPEGHNWQGFTVGGKSIDGYKIVVTDKTNENMCFAAEELQKYALEGSGANLEIVYTDEVPEGGAFVLKTGDSEVYGTDGFTISVEDSNVYFTCGELRGCMYAVYTLLEDYYGYRFYGYYDSELLKDSPSDIPEGTEDTQIPTVRYRCNCIEPFRNAYVYSSVVKNKLSGNSEQHSMNSAKYGYGVSRTFANAHSLDVFVPLVEYYMATEDPEELEWMTEEEIAAVAATKVRCLSDSLVYDICLKNMRNLLDSRIGMGGVIGKDITEVSCAYADNERICTCRKCNKVFRREGSSTGILVELVNKIDTQLRADYPGIRVVTNAYGEWKKPPKEAVLNPEVVVLYCWNGCSNHEIGSGECKETGVYNDLGSNYIEESYFDGWLKHSSQIYVWYYPTNIYYMLCPQPNFFKIYSDYKYFTSNGVKGFYIQGTHGSSFEALDAYLLCDLMWDTDMTKEDFDQQTREYLRYYFGYGWIYVYEYMQMLDEAGNLKGCVLNDFEMPFDIYSKEYFAENYEKMKALFRKAEAAAQNEEELAAIKKLSVHMDFLGLSAIYESAYTNGTAQSKKEFESEWRRVYDYINSNGIRIRFEDVGISSPFTVEESPMMSVYGISGERYK